MAIVDNAFREWIADFKATNPGVADSRAILDTAQYAFAAGRKAQRDIDAARQPVGDLAEPIFQIKHHDDTEATWRDATEAAYEMQATALRRIVYAAPPGGTE